MEAAYTPRMQWDRSFAVLWEQVADTRAETFDDCSCHIHTQVVQAEVVYKGHAPGQRY